MGVGVALAGAIALLTMITVIFSAYTVTDSIESQSESKTEMRKILDDVRKSNLTIDTISAASGSSLASFDLNNTGSTKQWDFEKFDVYITYDANIGGIKTKTTEQFVYEPSSSFLGPGSLTSPTVDDATSHANFCSPCTFSHTVTTSGSDRIIVVGVSPKGGETVSSVTYAGQSLVEIRSDDDGGNTHSSLWYRVDPATGANDVVVTLSTTEEVVIGAISLIGVDQVNPIDAHNGATGTSDTPSVSITTISDNTIIVDTVGTLDGAMTEGSSQTEQWDTSQGSTAGAGSTEVATSNGAHTMDWTNTSGSKEWSISAVSLKPVNADDKCETNLEFDTNEWVISSITNDYIDPRIINSDEVARVCLSLSYPIFSPGSIEVKVSSDIGTITNKSSTVS